MTNNPLVTVVTPIYQPDFRALEVCLRSVQNPSVEHLLILDGSENANNLSRLKRLVRRYKARLMTNADHGGISIATNAGFEAATGDFLLLLDQDDFLEDYWFSAFEIASSNADVIYSDTATRGPDGDILHLFKKPDWSPTRLLFNMYISHFFAFKRSLLAKVGGLNPAFDGAQDHELALRICNVAERVEHIPLPLYNWMASETSTATNSESKPYAYESGLVASQEGLNLNGVNAVSTKSEDFPGAFIPVFEKRKEPVSIVIPTAFSRDFAGYSSLQTCIESLVREIGLHPQDELVIVHGGEDDFGLLKTISEKLTSQIIVVADDADFNFSHRCNLGIMQASNSAILLLNDDIELKSPGALNTVVGYLNKQNVGLVGGLLLYPDMSIQHSGHVYNDTPGHAYYRNPSQIGGFFDLVIDREVSGVTGALMGFRKELWATIGGFNEAFPMNFNDVDFCQKVALLGYSTIQANSVVALHFESLTRDPAVKSWEIDLMLSRWRFYFTSDKFTKNH